MLNDDWKGQIFKKLANTYENEAETFARVMFYLHEEEKAYEGQSKISPVWRTLKSSMNNNEMFESYAIRLADDTKRAEKDIEFRKSMGLMYDQMLAVSTKKGYVTDFQEYVKEKLFEPIKESADIVFDWAWSMIPSSTPSSILKFYEAYSPKVLLGNLYEMLGQFSETFSGVDIVKLAQVTLGYETIVNIHRWWKEEISGARCVKNIIDSTLSTAAGIAGGVGGAALGSFAGPIGTVIGGIAGGIVSAQAANYFSNRLTQWLFGIPKEEALENAYKYFGIKLDASNHDINSAYRKLFLKYHPDKGGKNENFHFVQVNMAVIKATKGAW